MWAGDDQFLARKWRTTLILLGLPTAAGGLLFGFREMLILGISYAHYSNPTPEFRAAGDAKMLLALLLVITGFAGMACRRVKHLVIVGMLVTAVVINVGVAVWLDDLSERSIDRGHAVPVPAMP